MGLRFRQLPFLRLGAESVLDADQRMLQRRPHIVFIMIEVMTALSP